MQMMLRLICWLWKNLFLSQTIREQNKVQNVVVKGSIDFEAGCQAFDFFMYFISLLIILKSVKICQKIMKKKI